MIKATFVGMLAVLLLGAPNSDTTETDSEAIKQTALDYGQGWYAGDGERMERALHPDLAKRTFLPNPRGKGGRIEHMSAMSLVRAAREGFGKHTPPGQQRTDVTILDVTGNAACVKLEMDSWVDYMQMYKLDGKWVIVNVLWEFTAEAKKKYGIPEDL